MTLASGPELRVLEDQEALAHAAAELFALLAERSLAEHDRFTVALSGGSTPRPFYTLLASSSYRNSIDWKRMHLFWADERCVPKDHEESNFKLVFDTLLSEIPLPEQNIHRVKGEEGPEQAARLYEEEIKLVFGGTTMPVFDLIVLGVGDDGHTASLFPCSIALREMTRLAMPVYFEAPKLNRVTLSLPMLNRAAHVVFLVSGRSKAGIVQKIMENNNPLQYPAGLVRPLKGIATWLIDREAAGQLQNTVIPK